MSAIGATIAVLTIVITINCAETGDQQFYMLSLWHTYDLRKDKIVHATIFWTSPFTCSEVEMIVQTPLLTNWWAVQNIFEFVGIILQKIVILIILVH